VHAKVVTLAMERQSIVLFQMNRAIPLRYFSKGIYPSGDNVADVAGLQSFWRVV
jgi:hypothetical protein